VKSDKELAKLLVGELFQGLDINRRRILIEAAKCILSDQAFIDTALTLLPHPDFERISIHAIYAYTKLADETFGTQWPSPSSKHFPAK
jgi:hypothetical protein